MVNKRTGRQRGTSTVEAAIILIAFLMLLIGIMECGRLLSATHHLANIAREGARFAMVRGTESGLTTTSTTVSDYVKGLTNYSGLDPAALTVTTTWTPDQARGSMVRVQLSHNFQSIVPFIPNITLQSSSRMMMSN